MQEQLALMDQKLKERKLKQQDDEKPLRFAVRIEKPPQRPITPVVETTYVLFYIFAEYLVFDVILLTTNLLPSFF
jgi:hypothetical protein